LSGCNRLHSFSGGVWQTAWTLVCGRGTCFATSQMHCLHPLRCFPECLRAHPASTNWPAVWSSAPQFSVASIDCYVTSGVKGMSSPSLIWRRHYPQVRQSLVTQTTLPQEACSLNLIDKHRRVNYSQKLFDTIIRQLQGVHMAMRQAKQRSRSSIAPATFNPPQFKRSSRQFNAAKAQ
jgi:hypothetical protein